MQQLQRNTAIPPAQVSIEELKATNPSDAQQTLLPNAVSYTHLLLAVCREGASGGTQYTVEYAWQKNRELVVIDPDTLERRLLPPRLTAF